MFYLFEDNSSSIDMEGLQRNWKYNFVQLPINQELKALEQRIGQTLQSEKKKEPSLSYKWSHFPLKRKSHRKWIGITVTLPRSFNFVFSSLTKFVTEQVDDIGWMCTTDGDLTIGMI